MIVCFVICSYYTTSFYSIVAREDCYACCCGPLLLTTTKPLWTAVNLQDKQTCGGRVKAGLAQSTTLHCAYLKHQHSTDAVSCRCFAQFAAVVATAPEQCVRYCFDEGAEPLWPSTRQVPQPQDIPPCPHCGTPRRFELQVRSCRFCPDTK